VFFTQFKNVQQALSKNETSVQKIVEHYLKNIAQKNEQLNAFLEVYEQEALNKAKEIDEKLAKKESVGKLAGMVIGIKDNLCYTNHPVGASSKILDGFVSQFTATAVQKLLDEDAIIIGRLNCDEFAMGASNENSSKGLVRNAANNDYVPGGSSGGSAVAVQADMCFASLGSDTGGSIRQPASFCGLVGSKPTYGKISRWGLLSYASSFDQIGALTHTVEDNALLTEIMAGYDNNDATTANLEVGSYVPLNDIKQPLKIAYIADCLHHEGIDPAVKKATLEVIEKLKAQGNQVEEIAFPYLDYMVPCYYVLTTAEASSNLARYSGLTFGYRSPNSVDLESTFKKSRTEGFGPEVKRRIMLGTFVLSSNHYDAYYTKAQRVRRIIKEKTESILQEYDFIILPTTSTPAFKIGEKSSNPIAMYLADLFTVQANLTGNPALSIPLAKHPESQMPFGIQVIAAHHQEKKMFDFAFMLEKECKG